MAYQKVVQKTLSGNTPTMVVPFAAKVTHPDSSSRATSSSLIFLYAGRISNQKNIINIIESLENLQEKISQKIELWIAGGFDDFETTFTSPGVKQGENFCKLSKNFKIKVVRYGHLSKEKLFKIYHQVNYYISFSHYHDDDYCLSPIEALSYGLPAILSEWGGHLDLIKNFPNQTLGIPLMNLSSSENMIYSFLKKTSGEIFDGNDVREYFSIKNSVNSMGELILNENLPSFQGFTDLFRIWSQDIKKRYSEKAYDELYSSFKERLSC
jgi:glycosyltransferase involved in cell wall biosynthesis